MKKPGSLKSVTSESIPRAAANLPFSITIFIFFKPTENARNSALLIRGRSLDGISALVNVISDCTHRGSMSDNPPVSINGR